MKKKISIIGTGKIAQFHLPALKEVGFEVVSCCGSPNSKTARIFSKKNNIQSVYNNYEELLNSHEKSDCFLIATDTKVTPEILRKCLSTNKPILVEKPISHNQLVLNQLLKLDTKNVLVGYNRRFYSTINYAKKFISKNNPCFINVELPDKYENFMENSVHGLDVINYILPNSTIRKIETYKQPNNGTGKFAIFETSRGDKCFVNFNWDLPANYSLVIDAFPYRLQLKPFEELKVFHGMKVCPPTNNYPIRKYMPKQIKNENVFKTSEKFKPGFLEQAEDFLKIVHGKRSDKGADIKSAHTAIDWANKIINYNEHCFK